MSYEVYGDPDDSPFEAAIEAGWLDPDDLSQALVDVMSERARQINELGFTPESDDKFVGGELSCASSCYTLWGLDDDYEQVGPPNHVPDIWDFPPEMFKPKNRRFDLVRAAALILADIERLDRAEART